jgi:hypothetical protein
MENRRFLFWKCRTYTGAVELLTGFAGSRKRIPGSGRKDLMKDWLGRNKRKIIAAAAVLAVLAFAFWYGGSAPGARGWNVTGKADTVSEPSGANQTDSLLKGQSSSTETQSTSSGPKEKTSGADTQSGSGNSSRSSAASSAAVSSAAKTASDESVLQASSQETEQAANQDTAQAANQDTAQTAAQGTAQAADQTPQAPAEASSASETPAAPQETPAPDPTCTISISCGTILNNMSLCDPSKAGIIPADGQILGSTAVPFSEGESVSDVLQRVCKENGIQIEAKWTPVYDSTYVEGISNIYEFDVGENSGWMYKVNGWFPNYGCSRYTVQNGDVIEWVYTCNLGADVGGSNTVG